MNWEQSNWKQRQSEVQILPLSPLSTQEMLDSIDADSIYTQLPQEEREIDALYRRTAGRPILIGLVIDVLNHRMLSLEALIAIPETLFASSLVSQINR